MNRAIIAAGVVIALAVILILETTLNGNLGYADLLALAQGAGFQGQNASIAAAIALAESSGNPNAYNPETAAGAAPNMGSYGLWQIYLGAHPEFSVENLKDPKTNASAAFTTYQEAENSFTPWSTFNSGAYQQYLPS
jgi:hypothetical protein